MKIYAKHESSVKKSKGNLGSEAAGPVEKEDGDDKKGTQQHSTNTQADEEVRAGR